MLARSAIASCYFCIVLFVLVSPAEAGVRGRQSPRTAENIHLEMVFNYLEPDPNVEEGVVDVVWGSDYAAQPAGVYNSSYIPIPSTTLPIRLRGIKNTIRIGWSTSATIRRWRLSSAPRTWHHSISPISRCRHISGPIGLMRR